jgi:hypothetical protein
MRASELLNSFVVTVLAAGCVRAQAPLPIDTAWLPISNAEREMKAPLVEKDAGVEAIFWKVHVMDDVLGGQELQRILYHYVRLKVFDEKGKAKATTIEIPFTENESIMYVTGRTVKADGTELELKKDSIYDRDRVRVGGLRSKVKSFAMPGVEPGAIVEYRWREIRNHPHTLYTRIQFQLDFPVQEATYFIRPLSREYTSLTRWPSGHSTVRPPL